MSAVFHPLLPSCCAPAAAAHNPSGHLSQRRSLSSTSPSFSHAQYPHFPLPPSFRGLSSMKERPFAVPPCGCSRGDGRVSILACCARTAAASGRNFSSGVSDGGIIWSHRAVVFPSRRQRPETHVAAVGQSAGSKKDDKLVTEGLITELLPSYMFRIRLDNGEVILGYVSGKMRSRMVRVLVGDRVRIEVSRYDSTRGRIVYRLRSKSTTE